MWSSITPDIYENLEAVKTAFRRLVNLVPRCGRLIAYDGSTNVDKCVSRAFLCHRTLRLSNLDLPGALRDLTPQQTAARVGRLIALGANGLEVSLPLGRRAQRTER